MSDALNAVRPTEKLQLAEIPQSQPLPGQVRNHAGGYTYSVDDMAQLRRFLILGVEGGTYYVSQQDLATANVTMLTKAVKSHGPEVVGEIVAISQAGRAPSNSPAVFALAAATVFGNAETRALAYSNLTRVARTATHLFEFAKFRKNLGGGFGRGTRNAIQGWYGQQPDRVAYQAVKYRSRYGWTHRDLLRVAHPKSDNPALVAIFDWITHGKINRNTPDIIRGFEQVRNQSGDEAIQTIIDYGLSWEALPTQLHNEPKVWRTLIDEDLLPLGALIRQLGRMAAISVGCETEIVARLGDREALHRARIHPIKVALALKAYRLGRGKSGITWAPSSRVADALDRAFYAAFQNVEPAGVRTLVGLDVSASMQWSGKGLLSPREATAAMAMIQAKTEPDLTVMAFSTKFIPVDLSAARRLDDVIASVSSMPFGGTDCSLPMRWARSEGLKVDTFIIYTDNETWAGPLHASVALAQYRQATGIEARLIVAATDPTASSVADPRDLRMLDVVGFDASVPITIANFSAGRI